jgi:type II secretory pathway component GspD/PulD (secretin)
MFVGEITTIRPRRSSASPSATAPGQHQVHRRCPDAADRRGVGDTSLVLWSPQGAVQHYIVRVGSKDSVFAYRAAKDVLSDITGIDIKPMGPQVAITGSASPPQILRINALASRFPQIVPMMKELDVEMKKMIYMKVQILEAKKSFSEAIGMSWPGSFAGPVAGFAGNFQGSTNPTGAAAITPALSIPAGNRHHLGIAASIQSVISLARAAATGHPRRPGVTQRRHSTVPRRR